MKIKKLKLKKALFLSFVFMFLSSVALPFVQNPVAYADAASTYCTGNSTIKKEGNAAISACEDGYRTASKAKSNNATGYCGKYSAGIVPSNQSVEACKTGYNAGFQKANPDWCANNVKPPDAAAITACRAGSSAGNNSSAQDKTHANQEKVTACQKYQSPPPVTTNLSVSSCQAGFMHAWTVKHPNAPDVLNKSSNPQCQGWTTNPTIAACDAGVKGKKDGKTKADTCDSYNDTSSNKAKTACQGGWENTTATTNGSGDDTSDCIANGSTTLEWLFCPLTTALGKAADHMNNFIENQLDFNTRDFLPNSGDNDGVHKAWNVIKNLVSSVLIVLLLVMVISQALGSGMFEAYTVRKVLPRLVIAVIAMQLSWELCKFLINIADDLGNGLAQLITAPFGGRGNMDLNSILNHLSNFWAGAANVGLAGALVAATFITISNPAGAILVAFTIILSVLTALASILFRNVIIIACVMLSPLAILLWVMPGQGLQRYWKLWSDNFSKALLLFPLMVAIIYGGRIFAWIVGGMDGPGFIDFIMVVVGFFGPYFMLPRAFKWGGSMMSAGANAISKGTDTLGKKPKEYLKARSEEWGKERRRQSQERVSQNRPSWIRGDQFRSGQWDPLYNIPGSKSARRIREGKMAGYSAAGAASIEEENKHEEEALTSTEKQLNEQADRYYVDQKGNRTKERWSEIIENGERKRVQNRLIQSGDKDDLLQAIARGDHDFEYVLTDGTVQKVGEVSESRREAALGRMASLGGNPNLTALNSEVMKLIDSEDAEDKQMLNRFLGRYASSMFAKMPHWYKGIPGAAGGLSPSQLAATSGASMNQMLDTLGKQVESPDSTEDEKKTAREALAALSATWDATVNNENLSGNVDKVAVGHMSKFLNNLSPEVRQEIINSGSNQVEIKRNEEILNRLPRQITEGGDILKLSEPQEQARAQAQAPRGVSQTNGGGNGGNGGGNGGGGGTPQPTLHPGGGPRPSGAPAERTPAPSPLSGAPTDMQPMLEELRGLRRDIREGAPGGSASPVGEIRIQHGPEIRGPGTTFNEGQIYMPQERRARPPEEPPTPPAGS